MYAQPVLFSPVSNREDWSPTIQISDDQTGEAISLTDDSDNPLYAIYLEITRSHHGGSGYSMSPYYDGCSNAEISVSLNDYIAIVDVGTIQVQIPYTVMQTLHGGRTYDVFMRLEDPDAPTARQLIIGRLPVAHGGRSP